MLLTYYAENLSFLLLALAQQYLLISAIGLLAILVITRLLGRQATTASLCVWRVFFVWLALSPLWMAILSNQSWWVSPVRVPLQLNPCDTPFYQRFSTTLSGSFLSWNILLTSCWLIVTSALGYRWLQRRARFWRLLERARPVICGRTLQEAECWRQRYGIRRPVALLESEDILQPFTLGLRRPAVFIPTALLTSLQPWQLACVLGHEFAHVRRLDDLRVRVDAVVRWLFWFNPLVFLTSHALRHLRECYCDRMAVQCGNLDQQLYSKTLLQLASSTLQRHTRAELSFLPTRSELTHRMTVLLGKSSQSGGVAVLATATILILLSLGVSLAYGITRFDIPSAREDGDILATFAPLSPVHGARVVSSEHFTPVSAPSACLLVINKGFHAGLDISYTGSPSVYAMQDGTVETVTRSFNTHVDNIVRIRHEGGLSSLYVHLARVDIAPGERVQRGQRLGELRQGGHLHVEILSGQHSLPLPPGLDGFATL